MLLAEPISHALTWASFTAPARNEGDLVQSPGREDPLEKEMATHSSTLA